MPVILATQKTEIRVAQSVGPEFKPQYHKKGGRKDEEERRRVESN
jgi:hypothetical protein